MQSNTCSVDEVRLAELRDLLEDIDRSIARAVMLAGDVARAGACERSEGLALDTWLAAACRSTGADAKMLLTASDVLGAMPVTAGLFQFGKLSWGQVRGIVSAARGFGAGQRAALDARVGATIGQSCAGDAWDPDELVWAVAAAADDLRSERKVEEREQRARESSFLAVQQGLDGGVAGYFELDPILGATVVNALDAAAGPPQGADADGAEGARADGSAGADADGEVVSAWTSTSRGRQYAQAFGKVCGDWLGGGSGHPARPLVVAHVDLSQVEATTPGTVEIGVRGRLQRVTAATIEALVCDGDVQAVLFDGARPLAVSKKVGAATIPADTRVAVRARDRGCRWPGCQAPIEHCDLHHLRHRADGGTHDPDNLAALCRRHHTAAHRHGWHTRLDPTMGELHITRGTTTHRSLPRGTPLARPSPNGRCEDDLPESSDPTVDSEPAVGRLRAGTWAAELLPF